MPVTVKEIFNKVGLVAPAAVKWKTPIPTNDNGVYVISLSDDAAKNKGTHNVCEISEEIFENWKILSPNLNVNGTISKTAIEAELNQHWKPKETILYIGESTSETNGLGKRVNQFYQHKVGGKGPHTGGYWIKLLAQLENLYVYPAKCKNPRDTEFKMLMYFIEQSTGGNFYELDELGIHLPFANLKVKMIFKRSIILAELFENLKRKNNFYGKEKIYTARINENGN